jgi:hypothetical protein
LKRPALHRVFIVVGALIVTAPCVVNGLPGGHDLSIHLEYQHFFAAQLRTGEWYPRWLTGLNYGLGSPIFFVQYPLPYFAAFIVERLSPVSFAPYGETRSLGIVMALAAMLAGLFTYEWCSGFADRRSALTAALLYVILPYPLAIDLFRRAAVGEYVALAWLPLGFLSYDLAAVRGNRFPFGVAVAFALLLVSNLFAGILFAPVLLVYAVCHATRTTYLRAGVEAALALALGACLAGVYLVPALVEGLYFHHDELIRVQGPNFAYRNQLFPFTNQLFGHARARWDWQVWFARALATGLVGAIARRAWISRHSRSAQSVGAGAVVLLLILTLFAPWLLRVGSVPGAVPLPPTLAVQRSEIFVSTLLTFELALLAYVLRPRTAARLADCFLAIGLVSYFMMTRWSVAVWASLRFLSNLQFPWRFNMLLAVTTAGLTAIAADGFWPLRPRTRAVVGAGVLAVLLFAVAGADHAWSLKDRYLGTRRTAYDRSVEIMVPTYVPGADLDALRRVSPSAEGIIQATIVEGTGSVYIHSVSARLLRLRANCNRECVVRIGQFYYPRWRVQAMPAGTEIPLAAGGPLGLMELTLPAGQINADVELPRTAAESLGAGLSLAAVVVVSAIALAGVYSRVRLPANPSDTTAIT